MSAIYWDDPRLRPTILPIPRTGFWSWLISTMSAEPISWTRNAKRREEPVEEPDNYVPIEHRKPDLVDNNHFIDELRKEAETVRPDHHATAKQAIIAMNYGEFKAYCEGTGSDPDKVWAWATGGSDANG